MLTLTRKFRFEACHKLAGYNGDCARMHGHSYFGEVAFLVHKLDELGMGEDFSVLKRIINPVIAKYDHQDLGDFTDYNSTAELLVLRMVGGLRQSMDNVTRIEGRNLLNRIRLYRVKLHETENCYVEWLDEQQWALYIAHLHSETATRKPRGCPFHIDESAVKTRRQLGEKSEMEILTEKFQELLGKEEK